MNEETFPLCFVVNGDHIHTSIELSRQERDMLNSLPPCHNAGDEDLRRQIPLDLYKKLRALASEVIEDWAIIYNYNNGLYNLDVHKWFQKDLDEEIFCERIPDEKSIFVDTMTGKIFLRDDEELFELWQEYERDMVAERGTEYLKSRYADEIAAQTDISKIKWTLEF